MKTLLTIVLLTFSYHLQAQDGEYHLDETYPINLGGTISLTSGDADVYITGSNRTDVNVKIDRVVDAKGFIWGDESFGIDVNQQAGNLQITERSSSSYVSIMGYRKENYTIVIEAPTGVTLKIKGDDGDYEIKTMSGAIDMNIDDGDAELTDCTGTDFQFRFDDGDFYMNRGAGKLYVKADDGDLEIKNGVFTQIEASVDDGDVIIQTSLADGGDYFFKVNDADIVLDITRGGGEFDIRHDDSRISSLGNFKLLEKDEDETRLKLDRGTANVRIRADDASIRLSTQ